MIKIIVLSLFFCLAAAGPLVFKKKFAEGVKCENSQYPPDARRHVTGFVQVNLDESPLTRWRDVVGPRRAQIADMMQSILDLVDRVPGGSLLVKFVDSTFPKLVSTLPDPIKSEIIGISNITGLTLGRTALFNLFYEFFTVCTSILAADEHGTLHHARNMDFGLFLGWDVANNTWLLTEKLRALIVNVQFVRDGKPLFYSTQIAGYVGILTGLKPNAFSVTVNERFDLDGGFIGLFKWIIGLRQQDWNAVITREVFEHVTDYATAKQQLSTRKLLAPVYFIVGGRTPSDACVITRSRDAAVDVWEMAKIAEHNWFVVQTNYDHTTSPPFFDDRVTPAENCTARLTTQGVNNSGLFNVLSTRPVLNKLTVYASLMQVEAGTIETYLQYCPDPCSLW